MVDSSYHEGVVVLSLSGLAIRRRISTTFSNFIVDRGLLCMGVTGHPSIKSVYMRVVSEEINCDVMVWSILYCFPIFRKVCMGKI